MRWKRAETVGEAFYVKPTSTYDDGRFSPPDDLGYDSAGEIAISLGVAEFCGINYAI